MVSSSCRFCVIRDAVVSGEIRFESAKDVTILITRASGNIVVLDSRVVTVVASSARNNCTSRNNVAIIVGNLANRNPVVNRSNFAEVKQNGVLISIRRAGNLARDERFNNTEGEENCRPDKP